MTLDALARAARHRAARAAAREPGAARARCRSTTSPRGTSTRGDYPEARAPRRRGASTSQTCASGRSRASPTAARIGVGFAMYCEQAGARHLRLPRLGHPDGAGPRAVSRAPHARRRARAAHRRALARPGPGDHAGAGRQYDPRHRPRAMSAWCMATPASTPYSTGTWGSRCMVMSGGAVAAACDALAGAREGNRAQAPGSAAAGPRPAGRLRVRGGNRPQAARLGEVAARLVSPAAAPARATSTRAASK